MKPFPFSPVGKYGFNFNNDLTRYVDKSLGLWLLRIEDVGRITVGVSRVFDVNDWVNASIIGQLYLCGIISNEL